MKKSFKKIISVFTALLLVLACAPTFAADTMGATWQGDYETNELVITITAPTKYVQTASVVMYRGDEATMENYVRVGEVVINGTAPAEARIKLGNDLGELNYTVKIQGSGNYDAAKNKKEIPVTIATPNKAAEYLSLVNGITSANVANITPEQMLALTALKDILKITVTGEESTAKVSAFIQTRVHDYDGSYQNLNEVKDAWIAADVVEYLAGNGINANTLKEKYEAASDALTVKDNMADDDYDDYADGIYSNIFKIESEYGQVTQKSDVEKIFKKAKAMTVVNAVTDVDDMEDVIDKYYEDLGITTEKYNAYKALKDKSKANRAITGKNYTSVVTLKSNFESAVGGSGNLGGGDIGGDVGEDTQKPGDDNIGSLGGVTVTPTPVQKGFLDCTASHWAYSYVEALKESGIIGGYPDGKFYPENPVNREEFVKMIVLAAGLYSEDADCDFDDVKKDEWYFGYVATLSDLGLINGLGENLFGIGQKISREDVAVIVHRILVSLGAEMKDGESQGFADSINISDYAAESIKELTKIGILNGFEDGTFRPTANLSRAEAAKIISVVKDYITK